MLPFFMESSQAYEDWDGCKVHLNQYKTQLNCYNHSIKNMSSL